MSARYYQIKSLLIIIINKSEGTILAILRDPKIRVGKGYLALQKPEGQSNQQLKIWWLCMALATVTFWGESTNSHGIPQTFYTYLVSVYVNQAIGMRDKIVKIVPLTEDTPRPERDLPFMVKNSDAKNAFKEAFRILDAMESLKGLKSQKSIVETEREYSLAVASR